MSKLIAVLFEEEKLTAHALGAPPMDGGQTVYATAVDVPDGDPSRAVSVLEIIQEKAKTAGVELEDAVVVYRTPAGEVRIKQGKQITSGKGARRGVVWGLIAGLILGGPIAGLLWGLGIGAVYGAAVDHGIDDHFLKRVGAKLERNHSAVLVMVSDDIADRAVAYLKTYDTEVIVSDLNEEAAKAAEKAAENEAVARAVQAEYQIE